MKSEVHEDLIRRMQEGDQSALLPCIELETDHLLAVITQKMSAALRSKVEPQDIYQELLVTAFNSFDQLEWGSREPFVWLCQLADRRIIDAHRRYVLAEKRSANREVSLNGKPRSSTNEPDLEMIDLLVKSMTMPSAAFSRDQRALRMQAAIEELPEAGREAIQLRYVEGWSSKEIAEKLSKSDAAIRVLLSRTLKRLHESLFDGPHFQDYAADRDDG